MYGRKTRLRPAQRRVLTSAICPVLTTRTRAAKDGLPSPQSPVVPNKRLAHALDTIRQRQKAREHQRLDAAKTRRERRLLRDKLATTNHP